MTATEATRIKPTMNADTEWWWQQAAAGRLAIQRCCSCQTLRHPPRPMCGECRSMDWDFIHACGDGEICSYTVLHHPQFPGYEYPLIIVLVDLVEGTRFTAELVDCEPADVTFGMPVTMTIKEDPDGFRLPVFRPVGVAP